MGARAGRRGGLGQAQEEISSLVMSLDRTLDLVNRLSLAGEEEAAAKLIDGQRAELYRVVNSISRTVAVSERETWLDTMRRHASAMAAAALLVISTVAVSVHAVTRDTPVERAEKGLQSAAAIADPVERLKVLVKVIEVTRTLPPDQAAAFNQGRVLPALEDALENPPSPDTPEEDREYIRYAEGAAKDIQQGRPPQPPPAPASDESPVESIADEARCLQGGDDARCDD